MARLGADRTAQLIRRWAGGEIAPGVVDIAPILPGPTRVAFRPGRVNRLLGTDLSVEEQQELLARVGVESEAAPAGAAVTVALKPEPLVVEAGDETAITAIIPTWRRDIAIEADVAEEIARVAATSWSRRSRPTRRCPSSVPRRWRSGSWCGRPWPGPASRRS